MVARALLGFPRLGQSLWEDEVAACAVAFFRECRVKGDGTVAIRTAFENTLWKYTTTNHIFQSILARLSHSAWRSLARPTGLQVGEAVARLPSYLAGILAVGAIGVLTAHFG